MTDSTARVAIVTGGGSGIGHATALALADRGAMVVVLDCRPVDAEHPNIRVITGDVGDPADAERAVRTTVEAFGHLDTLINNAGFMAMTPVDGVSAETARGLWATNVLGPTLLTKAALPELARTKGSIVNVSSSLARRPAPGISHYGATKAAIEALTRSWALELADRGIRVNAVAPGPTESKALATAGFQQDEIEEIKAQERAQIPLGRRGEPADVARWIVALADPAATWITGAVIDADGGYSLS